MPRVHCLVTGTARHGRVRVWDMRAGNTSLYMRHAAPARRYHHDTCYFVFLSTLCSPGVSPALCTASPWTAPTCTWPSIRVSTTSDSEAARERRAELPGVRLLASRTSSPGITTEILSTTRDGRSSYEGTGVRSTSEADVGLMSADFLMDFPNI